jgi:hypothetical protein
MKVVIRRGIRLSFRAPSAVIPALVSHGATLLEDFDDSFGPDVGLGSAVVIAEIVRDGLFQFVNAFEDAAVKICGQVSPLPIGSSGHTASWKPKIPNDPQGVLWLIARQGMSERHGEHSDERHSLTARESLEW